MSEDLTKKRPDPESDLFSLILTIVKKLDKHETILLEIRDRLDRVEFRLDKVESRLDKVESRLDKVESRLDKVESRINALKPANSST